MINKIRSKLYAIFFWQTRIGELINKIYDLNIFLKYSFTENKLKSKESFQAFLTKQYHIIEKGLALPSPRQGFGKPKIELLIQRTIKYIAVYGEDQLVYNIREALKSYLDRNLALKENDLPFYKSLFYFTVEVKETKKGGVKKKPKIKFRMQST